MNKLELKQILDNENINENRYSLEGGSHHEIFCFDEIHGIKWVIYYHERGEERLYKEFFNEDEACQYFLDLMRKNLT